MGDDEDWVPPMHNKPGSLFYGVESNRKRNVSYQLLKIKQKSEDKESENSESEREGGEGGGERTGQKRGRGSGRKKRKGFRRGKPGSKSRGVEDVERGKRRDAKIFAVDKALELLVDRPTQLICISDIYLLSWRW